MNNLLIGLGALAMGAAIAFAIISTSDRQSIADCLALQAQSAEIAHWDPRTQTGFYITQNEADECASVHMTVDAPVEDMHN